MPISFKILYISIYESWTKPRAPDRATSPVNPLAVGSSPHAIWSVQYGSVRASRLLSHEPRRLANPREPAYPSVSLPRHRTTCSFLPPPAARPPATDFVCSASAPISLPRPLLAWFRTSPHAVSNSPVAAAMAVAARHLRLLPASQSLSSPSTSTLPALADDLVAHPRQKPYLLEPASFGR